MNRKRAWVVVIVAVALLGAPTVAGTVRSVAATCSNGASECDVPYVPGGQHRRQTLDVFAARGADRALRPAVVFVHGGGWWGGDKTDIASAGFNPPREAAAHGWVAFNVNYRLGDDPARPGPGDTAAPYRDQHADIAAALAWVRANAHRYRVDVNRIALVGASAGGHLALLAAYRHGAVKAVVSWAGPTNLATMAVTYPCAVGPDGSCMGGTYPVPSEMIRRYVGCTLTACPDRYRDVSPVAHVRPGAPATLQIRGGFDTTVPAEQAAQLDESLRQAGVESVVHDCVVAQGQTTLPCTHDTMAAAVWPPTQAFLAARL